VTSPWRWQRIAFIALIVVAGMLLLAACGDDDDDDATATSGGGTEVTATEADGGDDEATATTGDGGELSGRIDIDGSSTVFPVTQAMAEEFQLVNSGVQVPVGVSGTGGGFEKFCAGETDISDASRPIKAEEAAICAEAGIEFIEIPVAFDGLSVMVNPANDWVECLTVEELNTIWDPESEGEITSWSDIRDDFPDEELVLYGHGTESGTYDYFTDVINGEEGASRGDFTGSEDDNVLVQGIAGTESALGFFGYAYYIENQDVLKLVGVDDGDPANGDGCIEPSEETINNGTYQPLSRPIFIYIKVESAERPEVQAFVDFYLNEGPTIIPEIGYVPFSADFYATLGARFEDRRAGSVFEGGSSAGVTVADLLFSDEDGGASGGGETEPTATEAESEPEPTEEEEMTDLGDLTGRIDIDGSSTVFPVTQAMAEEFQLVASGVQVPVGVSGTGGGFEKFCAGETDISDASRPIKAEEAAICAEAGIEFIEIPVAFDGLSVIVNTANDWVDCLTVEELNLIWAPESEGEITSWNQIRDDFPDEELILYGPGTDSGTYDYFTDVINGEEGASRGDFTPSEDDNVLVQGVAGTESALGFFGYAYYIENTDILKLVAVDDGDPDNGDGCIEPSEETINDGSYQPLSRPIFIYVKVESAERPEVQAFIEFYLGNAVELIPEIGYVPFAQDFYDTLLARYDDRRAGSVFEAGGSTSGVTVADLLYPDEQ
jgi:phosphate binding protein